MPGSNRFLQNWSPKKNGKGRIQNFGESGISDTVKKCAEWLGKSPKNFSAHSFRRFSATALANSGISVVGLTHAGRWKSTDVAQEYIADTAIARTKVANRLDGSRAIVAVENENQLVDCHDNSHSEGPKPKKHKQSDGNIVYGNNYVINISGAGGGDISFLNGGFFPNAMKKNESNEGE